MHLLRRRRELNDADFQHLVLAIRSARAVHPFFMTAWVFLPDHWHAICAPQYPLTISEMMKSIKIGSTTLINRGRAASGELWQGRFFDPAPLPLNIFVAGRRRALRTVKEYNEKVEYLHLNPVKAGLVGRVQDWRWCSANEYCGMSAAQQMRRCGLTIDRVSLPLDSKARI